MPTWRIELTRDGNDNLAIVSPEHAPEWVNDLRDDLAYRFRESPEAQQITATCTGPADVAAPDDGPLIAGHNRPMTDTEVAQALGDLPLEPDDAAPGPTAAGVAPGTDQPGPVVSTGPGTPPPDAAIPPVSDQLGRTGT